MDKFDMIAGDEFDQPLGGLSASDRLVLTRTHVEAAVAEVRFLSDRRELSEADAIDVWQGMGQSALPVFERTTLNTWSLTVTPDGADQLMQTQPGWVLATADRTTAVTLLPAMVVIQTSKYDRFSTSLAEPLAQVLDLFAEATGSALVQRIGLRYINRLTDSAAHSPAFWAEHVRPAFIGPLSGELAPLVEGVHQQLQLRLSPTAAARIQSGVFRDVGAGAQYSFLVDIDVFSEQAVPFDPPTCANLARQLNRTAFALFRQVLSEGYFAELGPTPIERGN